MRIYLTLFIAFFICCSYGQSGIGNLPMHRYAERIYQKYNLFTGSNSSIRPFMKEDFVDSILQSIDSNWAAVEAKIFKVSLLTDIESGMDINQKQTDFSYRGGAGFGVNVEVKNRLNIKLDYLYNYVDGPSFIDSSMSQLGVAPGFGRTTKMNDAFGYHQIQGSIHFKAGKFFTLQAGNGKHFFGDGYRSLLLSDVANNYLYAKITTSFWKVKYVNLFTKQRSIYGVENNPAQFKGKYTATHYLDWNVSKRINVGLFETIVWQAEDTLLNRGFEFNYLNPIIFYRPVEYQQGSADNALMGLNVSVNVGKKTKIYAQFIIDEFLLAEIKGDSGWWANKYGAQIGLKSYDVIPGLDLQSEISSVKPYTYSHGSQVQNYGHDNGSLAHPYGSNFWEWVSFVTYRKSKWIFEEQFNVAVHGEDSIPSISYGGNMFQTYSNRPYNYNHFTGQGLRTIVIYNHLKASYLVSEKINLRVEFGHVYRERKNGLRYESNHYFYFGIKTNLWNRYNDY
ncbi:MAG: hypothetical protein JKY54_19315 [Flavobacteriales bacterium]|nr:hypothetical protein [Flavobacteriales bacterium]